MCMLEKYIIKKYTDGREKSTITLDIAVKNGYNISCVELKEGEKL